VRNLRRKANKHTFSGTFSPTRNGWFTERGVKSTSCPGGEEVSRLAAAPKEKMLTLMSLEGMGKRIKAWEEEVDFLNRRFLGYQALWEKIQPAPRLRRSWRDGALLLGRRNLGLKKRPHLRTSKIKKPRREETESSLIGRTEGKKSEAGPTSVLQLNPRKNEKETSSSEAVLARRRTRSRSTALRGNELKLPRIWGVEKGKRGLCVALRLVYGEPRRKNVPCLGREGVYLQSALNS